MGTSPEISNPPRETVPPDLLARVLGGDLPCACCKYNLKGLSVRSVCPECATPVRGTILATVDPLASELRPIRFPAYTAISIILWASCCFGAAVLVLVLRLDELAAFFERPHLSNAPALFPLPAYLVAAAGVLSIAFIRPHSGISALHSIAAAQATLAHFALAYLMWEIHTIIDTRELLPYAEPAALSQTRTMLRLGCAACMAVVILGVRPNGRLLVSRSLLMRTGRVDRQTLLIVLSAVGLTALGDALRLSAPGLMIDRVEVTRGLGGILIAVGSLFIFVGLMGIVIDVCRMRRTIMAPPLHMDSILKPQTTPAVPAPPHTPTSAAPERSMNLAP